MTKGKILIIEDEQFIREMYQRQFEKAGYTVNIAENGEEGLLSLSKERPDFILLDIILPKMDGVTFLEQMEGKRKKTGETLPTTILLTNLGQESILKRCLRLGAKDFLIKARFTPSQVLEKVEEILAKTP